MQHNILRYVWIPIVRVLFPGGTLLYILGILLLVSIMLLHVDFPEMWLFMETNNFDGHFFACIEFLKMYHKDLESLPLRDTKQTQ